MITDGIVEAAAGAYWFEVYGKHRKQPCKWPDDVYGNSQVLFRDGCRAAIEAAFAAMLKPEPVRWLLEERLPGGSIRWTCFEHEHQCRVAGAKSKYDTAVTPLYAAPPAPAVSVKGLAGGLATACALARIKYGNLDADVDAELTRLEALSVSALNTSPEPAVFTVEQIIAKIEDYGQDSLPGSEYRQACDDLIEEFSGDSSQRVPEPAAKAVPKGWQLVPVEPTLDMLEAGFHPTVNGPFVDHAWKAMLAAAPEVPRHD